MSLILIIDDHPLLLKATVQTIQADYPEYQYLTASNVQEVQKLLDTHQPDLVVMDLSLPEQKGQVAEVENGLKLLKKLLKEHYQLNIVVQSSYTKALMRLKPDIDNHYGGFAIADKTLSQAEMLKRVNWVMQGLTHTKDLKAGIEVKSEWLELLRLAFEEGLQDKAIAQEMNISERTVRHYWTKLQDVLEIYHENSKNLRILTMKRSREEGLID